MRHRMRDTTLVLTNLFLAVIASIALFVLPYSFMFVANSAEFIVSQFVLLSFLFKVGVASVAVVFLILTAAGEKYRLLVVNSLFFVIATASVQFYFLSESINILDGQDINPYSTLQLSLDLGIYALSGGLIFAFRKWVYDSIILLGIGVCLFQLINLGISTYSRDNIFDDVSNLHVDVSSVSDFSTQENVLHIVLDGFQAGLFRDIVQNDSEIASAFSGFQFYPDTLTASEVTQLSFAAFLTGREYTNNEPMKTFLFNSGIMRMGTAKPLQHVPNILEAAADGGFQVDVATPFILLQEQEFYSDFFFIHKPYDSETNVRVVTDYQTGFIFDLTLFRSAPKILKAFVYSEGQWMLSRLFTPNLGMSFNHHAGTHFLADVSSRLRLTDWPRVYKLFHLITPHAPFVTNSNCEFAGKELDRKYATIYDQARCALISLIGLLNRFKSVEIFDSATILIHGDHGIRMPFPDFELDSTDDPRNFPRIIGNANPLLLVKRPGAQGDLITNDAEVSLTDIPKTLSVLLQLGGEYDGVDFLNESPTDRTRRYYHAMQSRVAAGRDDRFLEWNEYAVSGPVFKKPSWRKIGETTWAKKSFDEFPIAEFLEIDEFKLVGEKEAHIRYRVRERHHFIAVGPRKRVTRFVGQDVITAELKSRNDFEQVCIVDTVKELRQCPR